MNSRLKVFGLIALLGFVAGIIAQVTATVIIPAIILALPSLGFISSYLISGFAGASPNSRACRRLGIHDWQKRALLNKS